MTAYDRIKITSRSARGAVGGGGSTDHLVEYILEFVLLGVFAALPQQQITVPAEQNTAQRDGKTLDFVTLSPK